MEIREHFLFQFGDYKYAVENGLVYINADTLFQAIGSTHRKSHLSGIPFRVAIDVAYSCGRSDVARALAKFRDEFDNAEELRSTDYAEIEIDWDAPNEDSN